MLSGPRNISTTMMRSFEARGDCNVCDEPFYACYLAASGAEHPMRAEILNSMQSDWGAVSTALREIDSKATLSFEKHIAFHFLEQDITMCLGDARVFHLIRDPRAMVSSYANKYSDAAPIAESFRLQRELYERAAKTGERQPIVDAVDIMRNPSGMLRRLCTAVSIPYTDSMLTWAAGPRPTDGVWGAHWYDAVNSSTGFRPNNEKAISLAPDLEAVAETCRGDYEFFHNLRIRP